MPLRLQWLSGLSWHGPTWLVAARIGQISKHIKISIKMKPLEKQKCFKEWQVNLEHFW